MTYTLIITWRGEGKGQTIRDNQTWKQITDYLWDIYIAARNESVVKIEIIDEALLVTVAQPRQD